MKQSLTKKNRRWVRFNYLYLVAVLLGINVILTAAMYLQYVDGEIPCGLCLLQRLFFFAICFPIILSFREGYSLQNMGLSILVTVFLLVVSLRQMLMHVVNRPGYPWVGSAIFGFHMPVWSIMLSIFLLLVYALKLSIIKHRDFLKLASVEAFPRIKMIANFLIWYTIVILGINFISVIVQCGVFRMCHTMNYRLLSSSEAPSQIRR